ncbi:hypothetical protein ACVIGB_000562 [Bradyrhizobium sp. USDA 4341]
MISSSLQDVPYMMSVLSHSGYTASAVDVAEAWRAYSEASDSSWRTPESEEEILAALLSHCDSHEGLGVVHLFFRPQKTRHELRHADDVDRIVAIFRAQGTLVSSREAYAAWSDHSELSAAGWLELPAEDDAIVDVISGRLRPPAEARTP